MCVWFPCHFSEKCCYVGHGHASVNTYEGIAMHCQHWSSKNSNKKVPSVLNIYES